jgi:hypothetical protein
MRSREKFLTPPDFDFELPIEPDFHSLPPSVPFHLMIQRNREIRAMFPHGIPTEEERLAQKVPLEFVL